VKAMLEKVLFDLHFPGQSFGERALLQDDVRGATGEWFSNGVGV
jgi:hypothetical protein